MTNFVTAGMPIMTMTDRKKGDFSNRAKCTGDQMGNTLKGGLKQAATLTGSAATAACVAKPSFFKEAFQAVKQNGLGGLFKSNKNPSIPVKALPSTAVTKTLKPIAPKTNVLGSVVKAISKSKPAQAILAVGALATAMIGLNTVFKSGQIDQKYNDRAAIEKASKNALDA